MPADRLLLILSTRMGWWVTSHIPAPWTHVNRVASIGRYIRLTISIRPAGGGWQGTTKRVQVQVIALLERGIQVTRSNSIRGHRGCIVMDDSDGIIVWSGRIDLTVHACFISLGAPVADAQRWVIDTFPLEFPA